MKTYVLYHGNCPDGFGAAYAAWRHYGDENAVYMPVLYGKPPPSMPPDSTVYIVDFSYPPAELIDLALRHLIVVVLDHHASAERDLVPAAFAELGPAFNTPDGGFYCGNIYVLFDLDRSGAMLAWMHFHKEPPPLLIQYLQDRDLWQFKLPNSRAVSAYLQTVQMDFLAWQRIAAEMESQRGIGEIFAAGAACLKLKEQQVEIMAKNVRWAKFILPHPSDSTVLAPHVEFFSPPLQSIPTTYHVAPFARGQPRLYYVPVANATCFYSEVGEQLLQLFPDAPFAAYYMDRADGNRQWGLRSRPYCDCSEIAQHFGGGGHKQAAGFTQQLSTLKSP